jgi:hypothetical protein
MLQGLQNTKQEPTPSAGLKEKITLRSNLKTKTNITVVRNPKSHVMNSVYKEDIFIAGVHLQILTSSYSTDIGQIF